MADPVIPPIELEDALLPGGGLAMEGDKLRVEQALIDAIAGGGLPVWPTVITANATVDPGYTYLVDVAAGSVYLTLRDPPSAFAVKIIASGGEAFVAIEVAPYLIEDDGGSTGASRFDLGWPAQYEEFVFGGGAYRRRESPPGPNIGDVTAVECFGPVLYGGGTSGDIGLNINPAAAFTYASTRQLDVSTAFNFRQTDVLTGPMALELVNPATDREGAIWIRQDAAGNRAVTAVTAAGYTTVSVSGAIDVNKAANAVTVLTYALCDVGGAKLLFVGSVQPKAVT